MIVWGFEFSTGFDLRSIRWLPIHRLFGVDFRICFAFRAHGSAIGRQFLIGVCWNEVAKEKWEIK